MLSAATGITVIRAAGRTDWRAEAWYLERSFPEEFAKARAQLAITGADGGPVQHEVEMIYRKPPTPEHALEVARLMVEQAEQKALEAAEVVEAELVDDDDDGYGEMVDPGPTMPAPTGSTREEHRAL
jgi:hypothetical protein